MDLIASADSSIALAWLFLKLPQTFAFPTVAPLGMLFAKTTSPLSISLRFRQPFATS